jgi:hypothetical protein
MVDGSDVSDTELAPAQLVVRESTGPAPVTGHENEDLSALGGLTDRTG